MGKTPKTTRTGTKQSLDLNLLRLGWFQLRHKKQPNAALYRHSFNGSTAVDDVVCLSQPRPFVRSGNAGGFVMPSGPIQTRSACRLAG